MTYLEYCRFGIAWPASEGYVQLFHSRLWNAIGPEAAFVLLIAVGLALGQEITVGRGIDEAAKKIVGVFPLLQGLVVEVDGDRVLVDFGTTRGAYEGMELEAYREGEEVKHPLTGQLLGRRDVRLAVIRIVEVKQEFSEAAIVSRQHGAKLSWGDSVRVSGDRIIVALPLIDGGDVRGGSVRSITKDLAITLTKTGRFMVVEEHLIRASLATERPPTVEHRADPDTLHALAEKLRAQALILGRLRQAEKWIFLDLQVLSTRTGATLGLASVELKEF